ncbi:MAG: hypothetical protein KIT36_21650 [Alphaproteobacteria bacterium]|nr:hypothetical protein [Alphaproteobacteria bacterium]
MAATSHGPATRRPSGAAATRKKSSADTADKSARIARQKSAIRKIMARYPHALRELAK